mmetsp:Transcript_18123/g.72572  ORF Transcript_18123/g.72572 Transcript_18123/m.72572 type:complete len:272 (-) Transcript_18123:134-949(-)
MIHIGPWAPKKHGSSKDKEDRILEMHAVLAFEKLASRADGAREVARVHAGDAAEESSSSEIEMSRAVEVGKFRTEWYVCVASAARRARREKVTGVAVPIDEPVVAPNVTNENPGSSTGRQRSGPSSTRGESSTTRRRRCANRLVERSSRFSSTSQRCATSSSTPCARSRTCGEWARRGRPTVGLACPSAHIWPQNLTHAEVNALAQTTAADSAAVHHRIQTITVRSAVCRLSGPDRRRRGASSTHAHTIRALSGPYHASTVPSAAAGALRP